MTITAAAMTLCLLVYTFPIPKRHLFRSGGAFMQTFMVAPQKKYYIHNNMFRYKDEVFMEAAGGTSTGITKDKITVREVKKTTFFRRFVNIL